MALRPCQWFCLIKSAVGVLCGFAAFVTFFFYYTNYEAGIWAFSAGTQKNYLTTQESVNMFVCFLNVTYCMCCLQGSLLVFASTSIIWRPKVYLVPGIQRRL